jgi:hypothetical protein
MPAKPKVEIIGGGTSRITMAKARIERAKA